MNKNAMKSAAFALVASAIFFSTGCAGEAGSSAAAPKKKISVAVEASYAPFEYKDENGLIVGFDVDLMKAVAQKMDAEAEFNNLPFEQIFHFVGDKKIQLGISAIGATEERKKHVSFSDPYYSLGSYVIVVRPGTEGIHGPEDLKGKIVAAERGTTNEMKAKELSPARTVMPDYYKDVFKAVEEGEADAAIVDEPGAKYYLEHGGRGKLTTAGTIPTGEQFVIIMAKDDKAMEQEVNAALKKVMEDGTYDKLSQKWFFKKAAMSQKNNSRRCGSK